MDPVEMLPLLINILIYLMLLMALGISSVNTVGDMIRFYRVQSLLLALATLLVAAEPTPAGKVLFERWDVTLVAILPLVLAASIEALLARATVVAPQKSLARPTWRTQLRYWLVELPRQAAPVWLEYTGSRRDQVKSLLSNLVLIAVAYVISFDLLPKESANSLAVSLALLLVGLSIMSSKRNIISQVMGLLVMEHGMFLAGINVPRPGPTLIFVISLFLYILITLIILIFLLPELHRASQTIEVEGQRELKG